MDDYYKKIKWGSTFSFVIEMEEGDNDAIAAQLIISSGASVAPLIVKTGTFEDNVVDLSVPAEEMQIAPGKYKYEFSITYSNGKVSKFPEDDDDYDCEDGNCELPTLEVCEALDMHVEGS